LLRGGFSVLMRSLLRVRGLAFGPDFFDGMFDGIDIQRVAETP
jgi:hypothetical protein